MWFSRALPRALLFPPFRRMVPVTGGQRRGGQWGQERLQYPAATEMPAFTACCGILSEAGHPLTAAVDASPRSCVE